MIYIVDHVLPESYYVNNLRALSVDMAVFRDLLRMTFPKLSRHLDVLQNAAQDFTTGKILSISHKKSKNDVESNISFLHFQWT